MTVLIECLFKLFDMCRTCEHLKIRKHEGSYLRGGSCSEWHTSVNIAYEPISVENVEQHQTTTATATITTTTNQIAKQSSHLLESTLVASLLCRILGYAQIPWRIRMKRKRSVVGRVLGSIRLKLNPVEMSVFWASCKYVFMSCHRAIELYFRLSHIINSIVIQTFVFWIVYFISSNKRFERFL